MSGSVCVTFEFLSEIVGKTLVAADVDNMSRTIRLRYNDGQQDIPGVGPATTGGHFINLVDAFVLEHSPGRADRLVLKRLHPLVTGTREPTDQEVIASLKAELHAARQALFGYAFK